MGYHYSLIFCYYALFYTFSYILVHSVILCVTLGGGRASLPPIPQIAAQIIQAHETHISPEHEWTHFSYSLFHSFCQPWKSFSEVGFNFRRAIPVKDMKPFEKSRNCTSNQSEIVNISKLKRKDEVSNWDGQGNHWILRERKFQQNVAG